MDANNDLLSYFEDLPDPRVVGRCDHKLLDIVAITVCAVISGLDEWEDIADYARMKEDWFRQFLELPRGIPSHDTFGRVFSLLDPVAFEELADWLAGLSIIVCNTHQTCLQSPLFFARYRLVYQPLKPPLTGEGFSVETTVRDLPRDQPLCFQHRPGPGDSVKMITHSHLQTPCSPL
jgi:hypothetical protein